MAVQKHNSKMKHCQQTSPTLSTFLTQVHAASFLVILLHFTTLFHFQSSKLLLSNGSENEEGILFMSPTFGLHIHPIISLISTS